MVELNKIYCEDCLSYLKRIPDNFVDLVNSFYKMDDSFIESMNEKYPESFQVGENFYFTLDDYDDAEGKWLEYSWYPVNDTPIILWDGTTKETSTVVYEAPYFFHSKSDTRVS